MFSQHSTPRIQISNLRTNVSSNKVRDLLGIMASAASHTGLSLLGSALVLMAKFPSNSFLAASYCRAACVNVKCDSEFPWMMPVVPMVIYLILVYKRLFLTVCAEVVYGAYGSLLLTSSRIIQMVDVLYTLCGGFFWLARNMVVGILCCKLLLGRRYGTADRSRVRSKVTLMFGFLIVAMMQFSPFQARSSVPSLGWTLLATNASASSLSGKVCFKASPPGLGFGWHWKARLAQRYRVSFCQKAASVMTNNCVSCGFCINGDPLTGAF